MFAEFARAFNDADVVRVTDVYAAGEQPIPGVDGPSLAEAIRACGHHDVAYVPRAELVRSAAALLRPGDLALTLGAGDITHVAGELGTLLAGSGA